MKKNNKNKEKATREKIVDKVVEKTGWKRNYALNQMKKAVKLTGCTYREYSRFGLYNVPEQEQQAVYAAKKAKYERKLKTQEKYTRLVMEKTGWEHDHALRQMKDAVKLTGCTYREYSRFGLYNVPEQEQQAVYAAKKARLERKLKTQEKYAQFVMEKTGWEHDYALRQMKDAVKLTGCTYREYSRFGLYNVPAQEQQEVYAARKDKHERRLKTQEKYTRLVMEKTGWEYDHALRQMKEAVKSIGCNVREYYKYRLYGVLTEEQQEVLEKGRSKAQRKSTIAENREKAVQLVMEKTGWAHDYAENQMLQAEKNLGISFREYSRCDLFNYAEDEQKRLHKINSSRKKALKSLKERRIETVMNAAGWDYEKTVEQLDEAQSKGIGNRFYVLLQLYQYPTSEHEKIFKEFLDQKKEDQCKKVNEYYDKIIEVTGWSREQAQEIVSEAKGRTGCTVKEFFIYHFYEFSKEQQERVMLECDSKKIMRRFDVDRELFGILSNKALTNSHFPKCVRRHWCVNTKTTRDEFVELFKDSTKLIYKPIQGHMGFGVEAFEINEKNMDEVYHTISGYPEGMVEEFVKQHPDISKIADSSVNTIRIVTLSSNDKPVTKDGKMFDIAYTSLRIGGGTSIVDNFHSGGMVAVIDKETGRIVTNATDQYGNVFTEHPVSKTKIKGLQIPYYKEALEMITEACTENKLEGYLGWDVAISVDGPELIEANNMPGIVLLSTPYAAEKMDSKKVMEPYMDF